MNKMFYAKLATINIKKNGKFYLPYLIASIGTIAMFYIVSSLAYNEGVEKMPGGDNLQTILNLAIYVIGLFSLIFLLYTNSFLMKRRKKEIGLYNVLGMEKRHISRVMFFETTFIYLAGIIIGLCTGMVFERLVMMLLCKLLKFKVVLGYGISLQSIGITVVLFGIIFLISLISNIMRVHMSNPIELLKGSNVGEREPKTKWILTILGILFLGAGYTIALVVESPLSAIFLFFVAIICVIIGTYCLFVAGITALMKLLRKNKNYYYKTKHFTTVSGMIYRMKQNAVGLANICILSTMVLVMISTTISMYIGTEDCLKERFPHEICLTQQYVPEDSGLNEKSLAVVKEELKTHGMKASDFKAFKHFSIATVLDGNKYDATPEGYFGQSGVHQLTFMTVSDYNNLTGKNISLKNNEVAAYDNGEKILDQFTLFGKQYSVKNHLDSFPSIGGYSVYTINIHYIVVPDESVINEMYIESQKVIKSDVVNRLKYEISFDVDGTDEQKCGLSDDTIKNVSNMINESNKTPYTFAQIECRTQNKSSFYATYGSFLFLGIVLGTLFLMITVLIIYYKQISEGYEDKERFEIMKKVGMSKSEVRKSIRSQVLTVFFLPLVTAIIHICFAFKVITKLLAMMNLTNIPLFLCCTIGTIVIFAIFYAVVYAVTARTYYKIVN